MKVNTDIKNIIFDLGNVILNIDTKLSEIEFAKYGISKSARYHPKRRHEFQARYLPWS